MYRQKEDKSKIKNLKKEYLNDFKRYSKLTEELNRYNDVIKNIDTPKLDNQQELESLEKQISIVFGN